MQEERTVAWLRQLGVLRSRPPLPGGSGAARAAGSGSDDDDDADGGGGAVNDWQEPCPLCGRTYYHVHKSGVRQGGAADADGDSD